MSNVVSFFSKKNPCKANRHCIDYDSLAQSLNMTTMKQTACASQYLFEIHDHCSTAISNFSLFFASSLGNDVTDFRSNFVLRPCFRTTVLGAIPKPNQDGFS